MSLVQPQQTSSDQAQLQAYLSHQRLRCDKLTHASGNVTLDSLPFAGLSSQQQQQQTSLVQRSARRQRQVRPVLGAWSQSSAVAETSLQLPVTQGIIGGSDTFIHHDNVSESTAAMYYLLGLPENVFFYFIVFHFILLSLNLGFIFVIFVYLSFNFIRRGGFKGDGRNLSD